MQQVWQDNRGHLKLGEVPVPVLPERGVVVRNRYSLISSGTERSQVDMSRKSLLSKALARPEQVRQVLERVKSEGLLTTLHKVNARLDQPVALGYSCTGVVVESSCDLYGCGQRVACAGIGYASHSEFVAVPQNLVAFVPDSVSDRSAATVTVGAIALQAVRQAEPHIGETVAVVGLGLLGQITVMILAANGCHVVGFDPDPSRTRLALQHGASAASTDTDSSLAAHTVGASGADRVIITAAAKNNGPIELAAALCRDRGRIVLVGDVGANLPRQPFYGKELELRYARSYGPGRYDASYEQRGIDYPAAFVRWTVQRNMSAYLDLVASERVQTEHLISHTFDIGLADKAYDIISGDHAEPHLGILLEYPQQSRIARRIILRALPSRPPVGRPRLALIGAGAFATGVLLPVLARLDLERSTICSRTGVNAKAAAEKFKFAQATTDANAVMRDPDIDWVLITTPHGLHASLTLAAMRAGKAVFVEKPLATNRSELEVLERQYGETPVPLMVGFNRRFAPLTDQLKRTLQEVSAPLTMHFRVLAGALPESSTWHDPETGGRICGELCHFVDYCSFVAGSRITRVSAMAASRPGSVARPPDNLQVHLAFENSSVATITYVADADPACGKEEFSVMAGGLTAVLDNFRTLEIWRGGRVKRFKSRGDKGHFRQLELTLENLKSGHPMPIPFSELVNVTESTLRVLEALKEAAGYADTAA